MMILTKREREVIALLAKDYSTKEIAAALTVELGTVKNHTHNILRKLKVGSRLEAVRVYQMMTCTEHSRSNQEWSQTPPVAPGWYWYHSNISIDLDTLFTLTGIVEVITSGYDNPLRNLKVGDLVIVTDRGECPIADYADHWLGPLPVPAPPEVMPDALPTP